MLALTKLTTKPSQFFPVFSFLLLDRKGGLSEKLKGNLCIFTPLIKKVVSMYQILVLELPC